MRKKFLMHAPQTQRVYHAGVEDSCCLWHTAVTDQRDLVIAGCSGGF
jgi:hypothetical protein